MGVAYWTFLSNRTNGYYLFARTITFPLTCLSPQKIRPITTKETNDATRTIACTTSGLSELWDRSMALLPGMDSQRSARTAGFKRPVHVFSQTAPPFRVNPDLRRTLLRLSGFAGAILPLEPAPP